MISINDSRVSSDPLHIVCWLDNDFMGVHVRLKVCRGTRDNHRILYDRACVMHGDCGIEMKWWAINQLCQQAVKEWTTNS